MITIAVNRVYQQLKTVNDDSWQRSVVANNGYSTGIGQPVTSLWVGFIVAEHQQELVIQLKCRDELGILGNRSL